MIEGQIQNGELQYFARVIDGINDTMEVGYWDGLTHKFGTGAKFVNKELVEMGNYEDGKYEPAKFESFSS